MKLLRDEHLEADHLRLPSQGDDRLEPEKGTGQEPVEVEGACIDGDQSPTEADLAAKDPVDIAAHAPTSIGDAAESPVTAEGEALSDIGASERWLGAELAAARQRLGKSVDDVAADLKVKKSIIETLEGDNLAAFPERPYAVGYIRSYATALGLRPESYVARYKALAAVEAATPLDFPVTSEAQAGSGMTIAVLALVAAAIVALAVYFIAGSSSTSDQTGAADGSTAPAAAETLGARTEANDYLAGGFAGDRANAAPVPVEEPVQGAAVQSPEGPVSLVALRTGAWLRIEDTNGYVLIEKRLAAGEIVGLPDRSDLLMVVRDAGAFEIRLGGTVLGPAGSSGEVLLGRSLDRSELVESFRQQSADLADAR